ncbi:threonine ammonia-lyase IlvA [Alistipes sp. ZOR0009]|uniref:threonine ammonia-lyase IlvA n=1 Tax=Alistipes sp. ZOR0009 TaxID=1339253 RepID=UPI0006456F8D|nr:threonine ammonia-lyase IlvA [Alistipes sp. ZOR0009]
MTAAPNLNWTPSLDDVMQAKARLTGIAVRTLLMSNELLSERYSANVMLKREDLQPVRSYKLRGAYNKIVTLSSDELANGVVCASAGNHAQGVAFSCSRLKVRGTIFMPEPTPKQKVKKVKMFGGEFVDVRIIGDTFDDSLAAALAFSEENGAQFIHPFDDRKVIEGQATVGLEIHEDCADSIDYVVVPVGGGGLISGIIGVMQALHPRVKIIAVEPAGAPSLRRAMEEREPVLLDDIETFVDGAAVRRVGDLTFNVCYGGIDRVINVPEGKVCTTMLSLYNDEAIVVEPAGALSVAALDYLAPEIAGKNVVCIISGSNNDIIRMEEIKERSLLHEGVKHYFVVNFPQRAGALRYFVDHILGPNDDITHFEYSKKINRDKGPAVVGVELKDPDDFEPLLERMKAARYFGEYLNSSPHLFELIV